MLMQLRENTPPFNNAKVRAAPSYAINRQVLNKAVLDGLAAAYQPFPSSSPGYNKTIGNQYTYKPATAKAMLAQAGFPQGVSFDLVFPPAKPSFRARRPSCRMSSLRPAST